MITYQGELIIHYNAQTTFNTFFSNFRELIWHSLMEILLFILPLVNYYKIRNYIFTYLGNSSRHEDFNSPNCTYCKKPLILAIKANCQHKFCYYCISSNLKADSNYQCPLCKTVLKIANTN